VTACRVCNGVRSVAEVRTYGSLCETCWAVANRYSSGRPLLAAMPLPSLQARRRITAIRQTAQRRMDIR